MGEKIVCRYFPDSLSVASYISDMFMGGVPAVAVNRKMGLYYIGCLRRSLCGISPLCGVPVSSRFCSDHRLDLVDDSVIICNLYDDMCIPFNQSDYVINCIADAVRCFEYSTKLEFGLPLIMRLSPCGIYEDKKPSSYVRVLITD